MFENHADHNDSRPAVRRAIFYVAAAVALLLVLWYFRMALLPVLLGLVIAYLLVPAVRALERSGMPTAAAIAITYLGVGLALFGLALIVIPRAGDQLEKLIRLLPDYSAMLTEHLHRAQEGMYRVRLPQALQVALLNAVGRAEGAMENAAERFIDVCFAVISHSLSLLAAPVLAFYFMLERRKIIRAGLAHLPSRWRHPTLQLLRRLDEVLIGFVRSRIIISVFVGVSTAIAFALLDLPFFFLIGVIVGSADLIPYFGPILGAVPALAIAAAHSPPAAIKVLIVLVLIQQVESAVVSPLVMGDGVHLHPIWIIVALFVGAQLGGLLGMLLGVPLLACIRVVGEFAWVHWRRASSNMV